MTTTQATAECVGIDLGSAAIVAGRLLPNGAVDILLTPTGGRATAPAVSFQGKRRYVGQGAMDLATSNMRNTITDCIEAIAGEHETSADNARARDGIIVTRVPHTCEDDGTVKYTVQYELKEGEDQATFTSTEILAMLLMEATASLDATSPHTIVLAIPDVYDDQARKRVGDACVLAAELSGKPLSFHVVGSSVCLAERFTQRYAGKATPSTSSDGTANDGDGNNNDNDTDDHTEYVMIADVGKAFSSVSVGLHVKGTGALELLHTSSLRFGCDDLDAALAKHVLELLARKNVQVDTSKRAGLRLLKECGAARKMLSANKSATVVLEAFGPNDDNYHFDISRDMFESVCATELQRFKAAVTEAMTVSGVADDAAAKVDGVELVGGATCIPMIQNALVAAVGGDDSKLRCTLDRSACVAIGAALLAGKIVADEKKEHKQEKKEEGQVDDDDNKADKAAEGDAETPAVDGLVARVGGVAQWSSDDASKSDTVARLKQVIDQDAFMRRIMDARNTLEAYVLNANSLGDGPHGNLFNREQTQPLLDEALEWIDSDAAHETTTPEPFEERYAQLKAKVEEINADMFAKIGADEEEKARQAKQEQEQWVKDRENEDKDDHDFRKLPKEKRMQQVMRNKNEATELFKGGNYAHATARYARALALTTKFFDLSPDDEKEVNDVKCVLNLNLAMCYIKQSAWKKALASCDEALAINKDSAKGWYRKALVLENMKDYDQAVKVAKEGARIAPEDAAMAKLLRRVEAKKTKAMEQQKKLFSKMFA